MLDIIFIVIIALIGIGMFVWLFYEQVHSQRDIKRNWDALMAHKDHAATDSDIEILEKHKEINHL